MYTHPALFNPYLISCMLTSDPYNKEEEPLWRTVKWYELEYVLTGEGGGFLRSCQPVRLRFEPSLISPDVSGGFTYLALHIRNVCKFDISLKTRMLLEEQQLFWAGPARSGIYPDGLLRGLPQKAGRLKLPAGFSGWVVFRPQAKNDIGSVQACVLELELLEPGGRSGALLFLDRPFFSHGSRLCPPEKDFNITQENFNKIVFGSHDGVAVWLKQNSDMQHGGLWNGASINIAYNPRFKLARPGMIFFHRPGARIKRINGYSGIKLVFDAFYDSALADEYKKRVFESAGRRHLELLAGSKRDFEALHALEWIPGGEHFEADFRRIFEEFITEGRSLDLRARLLRLLETLPGRSEQNSFCIRIKERLDNEFNKDISLIRLSEEEGVTPEHLCRSFKRAYGDTPVAYLVKLRLTHARRLLLSTDLSVNEIRDCCGFLSSSYFYTAFKRREGMAPGRYREIYAGR